MPATQTDFRSRLGNELVSLASREKNPSVVRLGLYLEAADRCAEDVAAGMTERAAFAENFTPSAPMHRIARRLGLGLDVDRGRWIAT